MDFASTGITEGASLGEGYRVGELLDGRTARVLRLADRAEGLLTLLALDPELEARFGQPLPRGSHEGVLWLWARGVLSPGVGWAITPDVTGPTLDDLLEEGPLPASRAVPLLRALVSAIQAVHASGELLVNLRPSRVLVLPGWDEDRVRIPAASWLIGPPAGQRLGGYCAPELAWDPPERASDQFSLGVIAYELLQGTPPHNPEAPPGDRTQVAVALDGAPDGLDRLVRRLLGERPSDRLPDLHAVELALAALMPALPPDDIKTYGSFTPIVPPRETHPNTPIPERRAVAEEPFVAPAMDSTVGLLVVMLSVGTAALVLSYTLFALW